MRLIHNCIKALMYDKLRGILSIMSVSIAVSSLSLVLFISELAKQGINEQINQLGTDLIMVYLSNVEYLVPNWLEVIKEDALIVSYSYIHQGTFEIDDKQHIVKYVQPDYYKMNDMIATEGRVFCETDFLLKKEFIILGSDVEGIDMLQMGNSFYSVIGRLSSKGQTMEGNTDEVMYAPYYFDTSSGNLTFQVKSKSEESIDYTKEYIEKYLKQFLNSEQIIIYSEIQLKYAMEGLTTLIQQVLMMIASVSFVVSLIGIANVLLVSVNQREYEIGILRAIGASKREILLKFLLEAIIISVLGFISGYLFSLVLMIVISIALDFKFVHSISIFITVGMLSMLTGVGAGIYPAYLATRKEIVDSLRI